MPTDALAVAFASMAFTGVVEVVVTRRIGAALQLIAALVLIGWATWMRRRGRTSPARLLAVAVTPCGTWRTSSTTCWWRLQPRTGD